MDDGEHTKPGLWRRFTTAVADYIYSPDPVQRACNTIALLVASNQPFYPFYIRYLVGDDGGVSFLTLLSTPFFIAVPAIARRSLALGLAALPVIGIANAMVATMALGHRAGVELFLIPCILIVSITAWRGSRMALVLPAIGFALYYALFAWDTVPLHVFAPGERITLYRLNMFSVAGLTGYILFSLVSAVRASSRLG